MAEFLNSGQLGKKLSRVLGRLKISDGSKSISEDPLDGLLTLATVSGRQFAH
jgi:hypothetical protein